MNPVQNRVYDNAYVANQQRKYYTLKTAPSDDAIVGNFVYNIFRCFEPKT